MPNPKKTELVQDYTDKFSRAQGIFFTDYSGMNVELMNKMRKDLRAAQVDYKVAKKTLLDIAAKNAGYDSVEEVCDGQVGIAFSYADPITPAKVISAFSKKNKIEIPAITGCIIEKTFFGSEKIADIVKLPSREELLAKLIGVLKAPLTNFVGVLNAPMSNLIGVLKSFSQKSK